MTQPFRFLVSFHYHQKTDLQDIIDAYTGPCEVFADSGAYSAASLGVTISLNEYAAWLKDWAGHLTVRATLDVIGDHHATMRNTHKLEDMGFRVLPVFHVGTPWAELEKLCAEYDYVALGGMVPHAKIPDAVLRWLVRCFQIARDHGTVFHGFGQTKLDVLAKLPFYSVDSSAWSAGMRFGQLYLWDDDNKKMITVSPGNPRTARRYAKLLRSHGVDVQLFGKTGFARLSARTMDQFQREVLMMRGAPAVAYLRMGEWLAKRHKVPAPPSLGLTQPGTAVYLADVATKHLLEAAPSVNHAQDGTKLYLAAATINHIQQAAQTYDALPSQGTAVYLAETLPVNLKTAATHIRSLP